jgi:aldehyde:ferredoxin oxidoreductase
VKTGAAKGMKAEDYYESLLTEYYQAHGWDPQSGLQTDSSLRSLDMEDVAAVLAKAGALSGEEGRA